MNQNFGQTLYVLSQPPLKVKTFYCTDGEIDKTSSGGEEKVLEQRGQQQSWVILWTNNLKWTWCSPPPAKSPACICVSWCSPSIVPVFCSLTPLTLPILYSQCFSLSSVSLIYILSSDQRTRWIAPLLSPTFSLSTLAACTSPSLSSPSSRSLTHV